MTGESLKQINFEIPLHDFSSAVQFRTQVPPLFKGYHNFVVRVTIYIFCSCRNPGSQWALEKAKFNILHNYLLVGVTEELGDFIAVLEAALPRFFRGAVKLYNLGEASS